MTTDKSAPVAEPASDPAGDLAAAPKQQLPEPVAWMHNGYVSKNKGRVLHDEQNNRSCGFKAQPVHALYTADQLRTAIAAERARTADTHAAYCHSQQQFHDAVAELSTLRQQLAEAVRERDALRTQVDAAVPAMRDYARRNPRWESWDNGEVEGKMQDPNGVNAWLEQIDAAIAAQGEANPPGVERELFEGE